jgi:signal transduction histidine kinase
VNGASGSLPSVDRWARRISAELRAVLLDTLGLAVIAVTVRTS